MLRDLIQRVPAKLNNIVKRAIHPPSNIKQEQSLFHSMRLLSHTVSFGLAAPWSAPDESSGELSAVSGEKTAVIFRSAMNYSESNREKLSGLRENRRHGGCVITFQDVRRNGGKDDGR
jgi:hypothetical protein